MERCTFIINYRLPALFPEKWSNLLPPKSKSLTHAPPLPTHLGPHLSRLVSTHTICPTVIYGLERRGLLGEVYTRAKGNLDKPSKRRKAKEWTGKKTEQLLNNSGQCPKENRHWMGMEEINRLRYTIEEKKKTKQSGKKEMKELTQGRKARRHCWGPAGILTTG